MAHMLLPTLTLRARRRLALYLVTLLLATGQPLLAQDAPSGEAAPALAEIALPTQPPKPPVIAPDEPGQYVLEFNRSPVVGNRLRFSGIYDEQRLYFTRPRHWEPQSVKVLLRYRHSAALYATRSNLTVLINGTSIGSLPLNQPMGEIGDAVMEVPIDLLQDNNELVLAALQNNSPTFTITIPFTLSVTRVLIAESRGMRMAFPVDAIEEIFALPPEAILSTAGRDSFEWNGELVQLVRLADWLHFNCPVVLESPETAPAIATPTVMLVRANQRWVGIQVERSWGEQEVALRRVVGNLPMPKGFNSCTIMGDGQVVPLVNTAELLYWIASCEASGANTLDETELPALLASGPHYEASTVSRRPTVLLIDDSINVRRLLALTLEKAGYQVAQAKDGQDALDKLTAGLAVEAIICDVEMPRLDGYGFLARLKTEPDHEDLPVAMLTSRSSQKHRQLAMSLGAAAYFTKPYNEQTLLKTLEDLIQPVLVS